MFYKLELDFTNCKDTAEVHQKWIDYMKEVEEEAKEDTTPTLVAKMIVVKMMAWSFAASLLKPDCRKDRTLARREVMEAVDDLTTLNQSFIK